MQEIQFFDIPNPTNLYGSCLAYHRGKVKAIVAARNQMFVMHSNEAEDGTIRWFRGELSLHHIDSNTEIISIDCISGKEDRYFPPILGVTIYKERIQATTILKQASLNIYGANNKIEDDTSDSIEELFSSSNCQEIPLDFIPFKLGHFEKSKSLGFLLSGSDCKIHLYQKHPERGIFEETDIAEFFPYLANLPSSALCWEIKTIRTTTQIVAVGCQSGYVQFTIAEGEKNTTKSAYLDGPISSVLVYSPQDLHTLNHQFAPTPHPFAIDLKRKSKLKDAAPLPIFAGEDDIHLFVGDSIGYVFQYKQPLIDPTKLPNSDLHDSIMCMQIADIDADGKTELLIGTYGQDLLIYKEEKEDSTGDFTFNQMISFAQPIMALHVADFTQDALDNLIVVSFSGLSIMQPNTAKARQKILSVLNLLKEIKELELAVEKTTNQFQNLKDAEESSYWV